MMMTALIRPAAEDRKVWGPPLDERGECEKEYVQEVNGGMVAAGE
jgi:hypothetical protein